MNSIEINICNQKYVIKGEEGDAHLEEVAEMVRRRVESIKKNNRKKSLDTKSVILTKAHSLLERVERELELES